MKVVMGRGDIVPPGASHVTEDLCSSKKSLNQPVGRQFAGIKAPHTHPRETWLPWEKNGLEKNDLRAQ